MMEIYRKNLILQKELMNLRFKVSTMQLTNVREINNTKKKIARIMTVIREREIVENSQ